MFYKVVSSESTYQYIWPVFIILIKFTPYIHILHRYIINSTEIFLIKIYKNIAEDRYFPNVQVKIKYNIIMSKG